MLDAILNSRKLDQYIATFEVGETLFLEGDRSQDLYILLEGKAGVLKGTKSIAEISDRGSVFGEMSFLLGESRTATVKALTDLKAIKIPKEEIPRLLKEFPDIVEEFARYLARRLHETSQIVYGLKEFCDQLPDAVILTDKDGKILTWNRAAERLYGRDADEMRYRSAEEIYDNPVAYKQFVQEVISRQTVNEKTLRVKHPTEGMRYVSTSTTVLYDGQHNFGGVLFLGRDVTRSEIVSRRYQRITRRIIPLSLLLIVLAAGIFFGHSYFSTGYYISDEKREELKEDLAVNCRLLQSLLVPPFSAGDREKTTEVMRNFFDAQEGVDVPFIGLVLLGKDKRVFDTYSTLPHFDRGQMIGTSYAAIDLGEKENAHCKVLTLYREHKDHPMGIRYTEVAFRLDDNGLPAGWLIFQMDMDLLKEKLDLDEEDLKRFRFEALNKDKMG
jgi:PAS domain S-box-containing protein